MVLVAMVGLVWQQGTWIGPEAGVAILIGAYLLKQLEMYSRRDAYVVIILSYFVLATSFLFSNSLYLVLYSAVVMLLITGSLVGLTRKGDQPVQMHLRTALILFSQSLPLLVALYFLFPRIGPIWNFSSGQADASVGLSETMQMGDLGTLARSEKLAFRVDFEGAMPAPRDRYWRALVFDDFDGTTWHALKVEDQYKLDEQQVMAEANAATAFQYDVYLEPTGQRWLMGLPLARFDGVNVDVSAELMALRRTPVDNPLHYRVLSQLDFKLDAEGLSRERRLRFSSLPAGSNPRAQQLALQFWQQAGADPVRFAAQINRYFSTEPFYYSLRAPKLSSKHRIDEFLFTSREGFCVHYASTFVFMMRTAGIPARMVGGYQGGEYHPLGGYLLVHQYDAHAWAEYWVPGQGWVRSDPTGAVAPQRVLEGAGAIAREQGWAESPLVQSSMLSNTFLNRTRLLLDYADYLWFKEVVSFSLEDQNKLLDDLLGGRAPWRIALLIGMILLATVAVLFLNEMIRNRQRQAADPVDRLFFQFLRKLEKRGVVRRPDESPQAYLLRVGKLWPDQSERLEKVGYLYSEIKYAGDRDASVRRGLVSVAGKNLQQHKLQQRALTLAIRDISWTSWRSSAKDRSAGPDNAVPKK